MGTVQGQAKNLPYIGIPTCLTGYHSDKTTSTIPNNING